MLADGQEVRLHDGVQSHGVEGNARSLCNNDEQGALELEVDKKGDVVGTLLTLGQLGKDQKTTPALASLGNAHTLQYSSQWLKVALRDTSCAHNAQSPDPSIYEKDIGDDDGNGEDPFGHVEGYGRLDLARPFVKSKEIDGSEGVGGIDGTRDEDENPQPGVRERREARGGLEVGQGLAGLACLVRLSHSSTYNVSPLLLLGDGSTLFAISAAPHGWWYSVLFGMYVSVYVWMYPLNGTMACSPAVRLKSDLDR